jgi:hypothetical protein
MSVPVSVCPPPAQPSRRSAAIRDLDVVEYVQSMYRVAMLSILLLRSEPELIHNGLKHLRGSKLRTQRNWERNEYEGTSHFVGHLDGRDHDGFSWLFDSCMPCLLLD